MKVSSLGLSVTTTVALGVLLGTLFALTGSNGIFASLLFPSLVVFAVLAAKFPIPLIGFSIGWLALCPFTWGVQTGLFFRLFADETPLLLYLVVFPFLYVFTGRAWQPGFGALYVVLPALVSAMALSFVSKVDLVAYRTFVSTYVLGAMLLVLVLQEAANSNAEAIGRFIVWITAAIAVLSIVERIFQRNPFVENSPFVPLYLSAELVRAANGVYRPYVSFFHPSEAGTFMALGTPFVVRYWLRSRSWVSALAVCTVAAGLFVNGTRGVWFGLFIAALLAVLAVPRALLWISVTVPVLATGAWIGYQAFRTGPFIMRVTNPTDLYLRLETWSTATRIFLAHPLLGVGLSNFSRVYSDYVATSATPDNIFVSTAVENGLAGLFALIVFLTVALILLRRTRLELYHCGLTARASFVRCAGLALISYIAIGCFADIQRFRKVTPYMFILTGLGLAERVRYGVPLSTAAAPQNRIQHFVESRDSAAPRG